MKLRNLPYQAYQKFDDSMMYLANKTLHAWNYTTGKTKADLENFLITGSAISALTAAALVNPIFTGVISPVLLYSAHCVQKTNKNLEIREVSALEDGIADTTVESTKEEARFLGPVVLLSSLCSFTISNLIPDIKLETVLKICSVAKASVGLSAYVNRADYLPPRKNMVRRAVEKLEHKIKDHKQRRPMPIPVPVKA